MNSILLAGFVMNVANHLPVVMVVGLLLITVVLIGTMVWDTIQYHRNSKASEEAIDERVDLTVVPPWYEDFVRQCMGRPVIDTIQRFHKGGGWCTCPRCSECTSQTGRIKNLCVPCSRAEGYNVAEHTMWRQSKDELTRVHKAWSFCGCCQAAASKRAADTMDSLVGWGAVGYRE